MRDTAFRPLNPRELAALESGLTKGRMRVLNPFVPIIQHHPSSREYKALVQLFSVSYQQLSGNFLSCIVLYNRTDEHTHYSVLWRGVSRRSYKDRPNRIHGEMLAFSRAVFYSYGVEI